MTAPAHVAQTLAREVKTERAAGSSIEEIARTLGWWLDLLASPAACLACVSRARRGLPTPCRVCASAAPPAGLFRWRDAAGLSADEPTLLAEVAAPVPLYARSDRPEDAHQAAIVAAPAAGHDDVDDWEYGGWWPPVPFAGQLVVGG